jgi:serine/threonine protein kinase
VTGLSEHATETARARPRPAERVARLLASPLGVLITLPALVVAVGVGILLVGRDATRAASDQMARQLLEAHATSVQSDFAFALDQAGPLLQRLRTLADPARPLDDVGVRLHDLVVGRPGVAYASLSFPDGTFRGAYLDGARVAVQESRIAASGTDVQRFTVEGGALVPLLRETTDYDPRKRGFYRLAEISGTRTWTEPYTFFKSHETGITCTEPVYGDGHALRAVLTVDFDVGALSKYIARPALAHARSVIYTRDGIILAYPAADKLALPAGDQLLRHGDLHDPAIEALFARDPPSRLELSELVAGDGDHLAAVAPIAGHRAGIAVPLDWYVASIVPVRTLLGPTRALERSSVLASAGALAVAVALALALAWNLLRMRRQVARSRAEARSAEARARELGSYRLVARLGAGGMGEVWRAEHRLLARSAAIKLIRPEAMHDPEASHEFHERFRREAQTLASMRSRHTIEIYDYGVTELGVFYYVMELLDGLDLESLVRRYGPQPAPRVIPLLIQACSSLAEAHDAGLLHRDIKPPNLFLSRAADEVDIVKLLDFGIVQTAGEDPAPRIRPGVPAGVPGAPAGVPGAPAGVPGAPASGPGAPDGDLPATIPGELGATLPGGLAGALSGPGEATGKLTQLGAMLGTPGFMAPEQILGMPLDARADLYALGCCAWWLLTGREVFEREAAEARILHKHIHDPVPGLAARMPGWCPAALEAALVACLAKEPADRPRDARALAQMLRAIAIPDELAWTADHALAWWRAYQPALPPSRVSASEVQVIMPGPTDLRPVDATSEAAIAQTIASPPPEARDG